MSIKTLQEILNELQEEETRDGIQTPVPISEDRDTGVALGTKKAPDEPKPTHKTHKTPLGEEKNSENGAKSAHRTHNTPTTAERMGLVATWSRDFGYVSLHDPCSGEWHDLQVKDAPGWAVGEARRRKELYKGGRREAYRLTSLEMEAIWEDEHPTIEVGIIEDHPIEEEA
jgi:hypothetical protein